MDGRSRYQKIKNMLAPFVGEEFSLREIQRMVMINIGSSGKTLREIPRFMIDLGLIKEIRHLVFRVELPQDEKLIAKEGIEEKEL
jgi:hypothetical protein